MKAATAGRGAYGRIWVVTADAARARIFRAGTTNGRLVEQEDLLNPAARTHLRERVSDRQGHAASARGGGHSLQRNATAAQDVAVRFARRVAQRLVRARRGDEVDRIYLLAEPKLLGAVRRSLDRATRRLLAGQVDKDLTRQRPWQIRQRLPAEL